ncbi:MAG TPA: DoxX family protein [Acidimicrobiales bacterium]|nr:DoxX family protein [Acidimicrobiales bacterium]
MNVDVALLVIRIAAGCTLAAHGAQKLFGWFGGHGIEGTGGFMESLGFPRAHAWLAGLTEFAGGLGLAVGLITPLAGAAVAGVMFTVIAVSVHKGFFNMNGGFEFPLLIAAAGVALPFSGAGRVSVDHLLGWHLGGTEWGVGAVVLAMLSTAGIVALRTLRQHAGTGRRVTA